MFPEIRVGHMKIMALLLASLLAGLSACAKYSPPLAPEKVSPVAVQNLAVTTQLQGVKLAWFSPQNDQRGRELKQIDGYRVYRKTIQHDSDIMNREVEFELLETIPDLHLAELEKLRKAAREQDKPTRRLKVDEALSRFEYSDTSVVAGQSYLYKVVPFNQGDVEGQFDQLIKVVFKGETSEVTLLPYDQAEAEEFA